MTNFIKNFFKAASDKIFTVKCPYCSDVINRNDYACENCRKSFPKISIVGYAVGGYKCISPFPYNGKYRNAVRNFKFNGCGVYAKQLAFMIVCSINKEYPEEIFDIVTCVPMHKSSLAQRGYNQAELLAKSCAQLMNLPYVDALVKHKKNKTQHSIKAGERAKNVKGVYKIAGKHIVENKRILLIDDIITTGNTLGECAKILSNAGSGKICCATVCAVMTG